MTVEKDLLILQVERLDEATVKIITGQKILTFQATPIGKTEEEKIAAEIMHGIKAGLEGMSTTMGMPKRQPYYLNQFILSKEEYEQLGKPTVGDTIPVTIGLAKPSDVGEVPGGPIDEDIEYNKLSDEGREHG